MFWLALLGCLSWKKFGLVHYYFVRYSLFCFWVVGEPQDKASTIAF
jgi:hypothetical protein